MHASSHVFELKIVESIVLKICQSVEYNLVSDIDHFKKFSYKNVKWKTQILN